MSLSLRWTTKDEHETVARIRVFGFAAAEKEVALFSERLSVDPRVVGQDILLAEHDGAPVGTSTVYPMRMWVRGAPVSCQGVAWVAVDKTHRRCQFGDGGGVATQLMRENLRRARDRGEVVSALMPFRASFYEHFGYGLVERRCAWTIPLSILPKGPFEGFRHIAGAGEARRACRQRMVEAGQCNIERAAGAWEHWYKQENEGYVVADQPAGESGPMHAYASFEHGKSPTGREMIQVDDYAYDSLESFKRLLHLFASLKDQYTAVGIQLPVDLPINHLLRESHVPYRPAIHDAAEARLYTRMQVRVLDHVKLLHAMRRLPPDVRGGVTVAIHETEGQVTRLRIELEGGRASAKPTTADPDVECADKDWASIVTGYASASIAARLGLIKSANPKALDVLDAFAHGPAPFCTENF